MSKKLENNKEKVVLYVYYDEYDINFAYEKEKMLRKFCKDKNYDITGVFRSTYTSDSEGLNSHIKIIMEDAKNKKFDRFLCYSLSEISDEADIQTVIANIIEFCGVSVETIIEGKMNDDFFFAVSLFENYNHKTELELNKNPYRAVMTLDLNAYQIERIDKINNNLNF